MVSGVPFEKEFKVQIARDRVAAWRLGPSGQRCSMTEKFKVQLGERGLQETQTGVHAWNPLTFGVTKKVDCFSVRFIWVLEFSPESFL